VNFAGGNDSVVKIGNVAIGGKEVILMSGPCSVESKDQIISIAREVKDAGAKILRGGAFKPRTSPYTFQGLGVEGLKLLAEAREVTGLPVITEIMDTKDLEVIEKYADCLQVGARNMQNFSLLKEVGRSKLPVMLKRGMSATVKDLLMSAEYILSEGNFNVLLCERGIRTFETYTRNTLDLNAVPVLKKRNSPSGSGRSDSRNRLARACGIHGRRSGGRRRRCGDGRSAQFAGTREE
jgi:3-deoxy-7-phosphoheptulonate synthase